MSSAYPTAPRVMAGVGALAVGAFFGAAQPAVFLAQGYTLTAWVLVACAVPIVGFLAAIAFFPDELQRLLTRWTLLDLRAPGHVGAAIVMAGTLFFVLGYGSLVNGALAYEIEVVRGEGPLAIDGDALFVGLLVNVAILVLPPLFYVASVGARAPAVDEWAPRAPGGPSAAFAALGLRWEGAGRAALIGVASALGALLAIGILSVAIEGLALDVPDNQRALDIARSITVLGALGLAIGSSVSEEVFFRGFLQPRIGLFGQAAFFALAHLSYVNVLEVVVTFVLALVFGLIYRATGNLAAPIAGHFTFNLLMLLAGIYAPDMG